MAGSRFRIVEIVEWLLAAGCVAGLVALVGTLARDVPRVRPVVPVIAGAATVPSAPANIRPGAISVPELVLPDGTRLAVGAPLTALAALADATPFGPTAVDRDVDGPRESRGYTVAGLEFVVVTGHDRILAIYR